MRISANYPVLPGLSVFERFFAVIRGFCGWSGRICPPPDKRGGNAAK
jgi:hypothetical protein